MAGPQQRGFGQNLAGYEDAIGFQPPGLTVRAAQIDSGDAAIAADGSEVGLQEQGNRQKPGQPGRRPARQRVRVGDDHGKAANPGVAAGQQGGEGDAFTAQNHRTFEGAQPVQIDHPCSAPADRTPPGLVPPISLAARVFSRRPVHSRTRAAISSDGPIAEVRCSRPPGCSAVSVTAQRRTTPALIARSAGHRQYRQNSPPC